MCDCENCPGSLTRMLGMSRCIGKERLDVQRKRKTELANNNVRYLFTSRDTDAGNEKESKHQIFSTYC